MLIILGKTASGKDTVVNKLVKEYGYHKLITYTTRPMRDGEVQDKTYHFVTEEAFKQMEVDKVFLEFKNYESVGGIWYYGSAKKDYEKSDGKTVVILTPDGYKDFLKLYPNKKHTSIYIYSSEQTIAKRLRKRGDKLEEAARRLGSDRKDFKGTEHLVDRIFYNNTHTNIDYLVEQIVQYMKEKTDAE